MTNGQWNALANGIVGGGIILVGFTFCVWVIKGFFRWLISLTKGK